MERRIELNTGLCAGWTRGLAGLARRWTVARPDRSHNAPLATRSAAHARAVAVQEGRWFDRMVRAGGGRESSTVDASLAWAFPRN